MNIPDLKTLKKWLPFVANALFIAWMGLLVVLTLLFPPGKNKAASPSPQAMPSARGVSHEAAPGCTAMPDGLLICDELPKSKPGNAP